MFFIRGKYIMKLNCNVSFDNIITEKIIHTFKESYFYLKSVLA